MRAHSYPRNLAFNVDWFSVECPGVPLLHTGRGPGSHRRGQLLDDGDVAHGPAAPALLSAEGRAGQEVGQRVDFFAVPADVAVTVPVLLLLLLMVVVVAVAAAAVVVVVVVMVVRVLALVVRRPRAVSHDLLARQPLGLAHAHGHVWPQRPFAREAAAVHLHWLALVEIVVDDEVVRRVGVVDQCLLRDAAKQVGVQRRGRRRRRVAQVQRGRKRNALGHFGRLRARRRRGRWARSARWQRGAVARARRCVRVERDAAVRLLHHHPTFVPVHQEKQCRPQQREEGGKVVARLRVALIDVT
jgi:hypothetical protein